MEGIEVCPQCGIPSYITGEHTWHSSGFILQNRDIRHILIFIESDNLETLLKGVEGILGVSIERIVINTRRRAARAYMDRVIPDILKEQVRSGKLDVGKVIQGMLGIGYVLGYGKFEVVDWRLKGDDDDYLLINVEKPYSVTLGTVDPVAAFEAVVGREMGFSYREVSNGVYQIKAFPSPHPEEFKGRLIMRKYAYGEGNIRFQRCNFCGAPTPLGEFTWDLDRGLINHRGTGRRMVFFAPSVLEAVFDELENELGETIPEVVIEAQRRLTREGIYSLDPSAPEKKLREQLAIRGLGNLASLSMGEKGMVLRMENATVHLMLVGLAQGLFESAYGVESEVSWEVLAEGGLEIKVSPA